MPITPKSESENVVFSKPRLPSNGSKTTGKKVISRPLVKAPAIAPFLPPVELPNTPAVAPVKKCGTTPGKIKVKLKAPSNARPTKPPKKLNTKPIITAFGA